VRPAAEHSQHSTGVALIERLAEDVAVHNDRGVRGEHRAATIELVDGTRLSFRKARHVLRRRFASDNCFVDIRRLHVKVDAGSAQQFGAAR
jgi:hypothetical protein